MASMRAYLDDFGKITIYIRRQFYNGKSDSFYLSSDGEDKSNLVINFIEELVDEIKYEVTAIAGLRLGEHYYIHEQHGLTVPLHIRNIVNTEQFNERFTYHGTDLGSTYEKSHTDFALWAPTANSVVIKIRANQKVYTYPMERGKKGVYRLRVTGDLKQATYTYLVERNGEIVETVDPYGLSSTANGKETAVIDLNELEKIEDNECEEKIHGVDAIIYEASVRDMTSQASANTKAKGTFAALSELDTHYREIPTGLSHILSLGVTHLQLLPVMDFATVDEKHPEMNYNWGYDPSQYIVPEGSYSSDANNPYARMKELKSLIATCHKHGLRVNLDVVFNHVYDVGGSPFDKVVPYYYFRYNQAGYLSNGSYCGNDFASEKPMVRKYIVQAVEKIFRIYGIDGMRFDLMGVLDVDTMNEIVAKAKKIKKEAMIYGEGWNMPTLLAEDKKAGMHNQSRMPEVGHFNDFFRDSLKGKTSDDQRYEKGYLTGDLGMAYSSLSALSANVLAEPYYKRFDAPHQSINALETHDNHTVWDKMHFCCGNEDRATRQRRQKMMILSTLLAQGVPFLHAGMEFCATKRDNGNSYNAGDAINQMDWKRAYTNKEIVEYTRRCIQLRKQYASLRFKSAKEIQENVRLSTAEGGVVFYEINCVNDHKEIMRIMINPSYEEKRYVFEDGFRILFDENGGEKNMEENTVIIPGISVIVCIKEQEGNEK